jgi:carboxyl-terminal processing protease
MRAPFVVLIGFVATLALGLWLGGHSRLLPDPLRDFASGDDDVQVVADAIDRVSDDYYRPLDRRALADKAVDGVVEGLDQFSGYFDAKEYARFRESTDARFSGIGVTVEQVDDGLRIGTVYDGSPARKAGLRRGDVIVAADGKRLGDQAEDAAVSRVRGRAGTAVRLTIRRGDERFDRTLERAEVSVPAVEAARRTRGGKEYAVVRLAGFSSGSHGEVYAAVKQALDDDVAGLVFDLRGNGGGLVEEARLVASAFLREGPIVTTRGRAVKERVYRASGDPVAPDLPVVVLVDAGTASAAEIVAGALQDRGRARVVGERTFGKGVFQEVVELPNGGALDLTVGQYFTPKGRNLGKGVERGGGIRPDVRAKDDPETERRDEAVERAIATLPGAGGT